jgi:hypothetical protein
MGADDSSIYTRSELSRWKINIMDWSLKHYDSFNFQNFNPNKSFYIADVGNEIRQFSMTNSNYFVYSSFKINVYEKKDGSLLKSFKAPSNLNQYFNWFNGEHLLLFNSEKCILSIYDKCGDPVRCVQLDFPYQNQTNCVFGIDQHNQIYAYNSDFLYSIC